MTDNQNPEQKDRDNIDALLKQAGWVVQHNKNINPGEGIGQAVREYPTDTGPADYVLFIDKKAVGVIEAKREDLGHNITTVEQQTGEYAAAKLKWANNKQPLPFLYESTGIITRFTDARDPKPRSREVFSFHRPETIKGWLAQGNIVRHRDAVDTFARIHPARRLAQAHRHPIRLRHLVFQTPQHKHLRLRPADIEKIILRLVAMQLERKAAE